jgi:hypothetical protein
MIVKNAFLTIKKYKLAILVFVFSLAIIQGISFTLMNNYNESMGSDALIYMEMAKGNFDQNPIQKYRVVVPMLAAGINFIFGGLFEKIKPWSFERDFSLFVSFWIINNIIVAFFGLVTFLLCRAYNISLMGSILGLLVLLTCRWTAYMAGLPLIDSLFCLVSALALLGIKERNNNIIIFCILIGPWAKESFIFVAPVIFFFSSLNKFKQVGWFLFSGFLVFTFRFYFDQYTGTTMGDSLRGDLSHLSNFYKAIFRLFSFHGIYEIFSVTGLWIILPCYLMISNMQRFKGQLKELNWYMYAYLLCVFVQAIISEELARMFYLALPVLSVCVALSIDSLIPSLRKVDVEMRLFKNE